MTQKVTQNGHLNLDQLIQQAREAAPQFHDITQSILSELKAQHPDKFNDVVLEEGLKSRDRIEAKVDGDYGGKHENITDILRGRIIVESADEIQAVRDYARQMSNEYDVTSLNDRFANPSGTGFRDVNMTIRLDNGHIAEFRFEQKDMVEYGKLSHYVYEKSQEIERAATEETKRNGGDTPQLTPEQKEDLRINTTVNHYLHQVAADIVDQDKFLDEAGKQKILEAHLEGAAHEIGTPEASQKIHELVKEAKEAVLYKGEHASLSQESTKELSRQENEALTATASNENDVEKLAQEATEARAAADQKQIELEKAQQLSVEKEKTAAETAKAAADRIERLEYSTQLLKDEMANLPPNVAAVNEKVCESHQAEIAQLNAEVARTAAESEAAKAAVAATLIEQQDAAAKAVIAEEALKEAEAKRQEEEQKKLEAQRVEEQEKAAEEAKKAEEAVQQKQEEAKQAEEVAQQKAEEARTAEMVAQQKEAEAQEAQETAQQKAAEAEKAEEVALQKEEEAQKADAVAKQAAEAEQAKADAEQQTEEAQKTEEASKQANEEKQESEEVQKAEEAAKQAAIEAEAARAEADQKIEEAKQAEEVAAQKADEALDARGDADYKADETQQAEAIAQQKAAEAQAVTTALAEGTTVENVETEQKAAAQEIADTKSEQSIQTAEESAVVATDEAEVAQADQSNVQDNNVAEAAQAVSVVTEQPESTVQEEGNNIVAASDEHLDNSQITNEAITAPQVEAVSRGNTTEAKLDESSTEQQDKAVEQTATEANISSVATAEESTVQTVGEDVQSSNAVEATAIAFQEEQAADQSLAQGTEVTANTAEITANAESATGEATQAEPQDNPPVTIDKKEVSEEVEGDMGETIVASPDSSTAQSTEEKQDSYSAQYASLSSQESEETVEAIDEKEGESEKVEQDFMIAASQVTTMTTGNGSSGGGMCFATCTDPISAEWSNEAMFMTEYLSPKQCLSEFGGRTRMRYVLG